MSRSFDRLVVAGYRGRTAAELADAPADALIGVSAGDAEHLRAAFGISTVGQLATQRAWGAAAAIAGAATDTPGFDPGPPPVWAARLEAAPLDVYEQRPDLFRIDFGPVFYRGRLDGTARVLVVGQDPSVNEILAQRAFVGQSGQRLQGFLGKLGLARSYVMLNTFLYSIFNQFGGANAALSRQDPILGYRNSLFDVVAERNPLEAVITVGSAARDAVDRWEASGDYTRTHILHPAFPDTGRLLDDWNQALGALAATVAPDDGHVAGAAYGSDLAPEDTVPIPRRDLPFGLPAWHGTADHGKRKGDTIIEWHRNPV